MVLKTLARLHLLLSTMPNTHVHWAIAEYNEGDDTTNDTSFTNHEISDTRKKRKAHLLGCLGLRVLSHLDWTLLILISLIFLFIIYRVYEMFLHQQTLQVLPVKKQILYILQFLNFFLSFFVYLYMCQ